MPGTDASGAISYKTRPLIFSDALQFELGFIDGVTALDALWPLKSPVATRSEKIDRLIRLHGCH